MNNSIQLEQISFFIQVKKYIYRQSVLCRQQALIQRRDLDIGMMPQELYINIDKISSIDIVYPIKTFRILPLYGQCWLDQAEGFAITILIRGHTSSPSQEFMPQNFLRRGSTLIIKQK